MQYASNLLVAIFLADSSIMKLWHKLGGGGILIISIVLIVVLSVVLTRKHSVVKATRSPVVTIPPSMTTAELANIIMSVPQDPIKGWIGYGGPFKSHLYKEKLVDEPQYHVTDKSMFIQQCVGAYGPQDGAVIAEAAWRAYGMYL